mmetsp:Transcript_6325/g.18026  ORF Transcript_6325/g.18026 Transcript_6325/m.18026 type:complete len:368 (+) Transcript_6325:535-1638(+)
MGKAVFDDDDDDNDDKSLHNGRDGGSSGMGKTVFALGTSHWDRKASRRLGKAVRARKRQGCAIKKYGWKICRQIPKQKPQARRLRGSWEHGKVHSQGRSELCQGPEISAVHGHSGSRGRRKVDPHGADTGPDQPDLQAGRGQAGKPELAPRRERIGTGPGSDHGNRNQDPSGAQARHCGAGCPRAPRFHTSDDHGCRQRGCCHSRHRCGHGRIRGGFYGRRPNQGTHHAGQGFGRDADHRGGQQARRRRLETGPLRIYPEPGEGFFATTRIQAQADAVRPDFRFGRRKRQDSHQSTALPMVQGTHVVGGCEQFFPCQSAGRKTSTIHSHRCLCGRKRNSDAWSRHPGLCRSRRFIGGLARRRHCEGL